MFYESGPVKLGKGPEQSPPRHLEIIKEILKSHVPEYEVWIFDSRFHRNRVKKFSDLDLAVITDKPLDVLRLAKLQDAFSESDLPFKVDVIDWAMTDGAFRRIIEGNCEVVQRAEKAGR